jgi:hypothetical protein
MGFPVQWGMPRFRKVIRIALLALLAGAGLNGIMVFLFFDGTNFYGHLYSLQAKAQAELDARRIRELEGRVERERMEGALARIRAEESLRKEYAHLDSAIGNADIQFRGRLPKRALEEGFRARHPFRIAEGKLSVRVGGETIYSETLPRYARLRISGSGASPIRAAAADLGGPPLGDSAFAFVLSMRTGPRERWDAYRRLDDSTYAYFCGYLMDTAGKRLLWRGVDVDRQPLR